QVAPGIGKPDAVAADSAEAGADAEQFARAEPVPHAHDDQDAGESQDESSDALRGRPLLAKHGEDHEKYRDGGQSVDDPGQDGRDVSLPVGEEGERDAVEE